MKQGSTTRRLIEESLQRDPLTHSEIARVVGVSREYVRQVAKRTGETGRARQDWVLAPKREAKQRQVAAERFRYSFARAMRRHLHEAGLWQCDTCRQWFCLEDVTNTNHRARCHPCNRSNVRRTEDKRHLAGRCIQCGLPLDGKSSWRCLRCERKLNTYRRNWRRRVRNEKVLHSHLHDPVRD